MRIVVPFVLIGSKVITVIILLLIYFYCVYEARGCVLGEFKIEHVEINVNCDAGSVGHAM